MDISRRKKESISREGVILCGKYSVVILGDTCLSQYVPSLGFFHNDQTCVDVIILCVLQLHATVIDCREVRKRHTPHIEHQVSRVKSTQTAKGYVCVPTRADISVSVSVAVLRVLGDSEGALVGLVPDFL